MMKRKRTNVRRRLQKLRDRLNCRGRNQNVSEFDKTYSIPRVLIFLTGLISNENLFREKQFSVFAEIVALFVVASVAVVQWIFMVITAITEFRRDIYAGWTMLPYLFAGLVLVIQAIPLYFRKREFQNFIRELQSLRTPENASTVNDATSSMKRSLFMSGMCLVLGIVTTLLFILRPIYGVATSSPDDKSETYFDTKVFHTQYPVAVDTTLKYVAFNLWEGYVAVYVCIARLAINTSFIQLSGFISWHFQVLGSTLRNIVTRRNRRNESALLKRLHELAHHHSILLTHCHKLENLFNHIILSILVYTGLSLGVSVITIQKDLSNQNYAGCVSFVIYFLFVILEAFTICDNAEMITHWSGDVSQAVFDCRWTGCSETFKKSMRIIMAVAQKGYRFKAYGFYELNRVQVAKILLLTVNIITVIRAVKLKKGY